MELAHAIHPVTLINPATEQVVDIVPGDEIHWDGEGFWVERNERKFVWRRGDEKLATWNPGMIGDLTTVAEGIARDRGGCDVREIDVGERSRMWRARRSQQI